MDKTQFNFSPSEELCPFDSIKWEKLKARGNCSDQELYHCLPNQYNVHGQICVKPNWVLKNYCPIYNTVAAKIDLIPCDSQYGACSDNDYRSNQVYMYSGCLNKTEILEEITDTPPKQVPLSLSPLLSILISSAVVLVVLILIALGTWLYRRRRKAIKYERYEMEPLLSHTDIPPGMQKNIDYLDNRVFSPSKVYEHAIGVLDINNCITIIGPPGSGKTLTALQLACRKCGKDGKSKLYFCQNLDEISAKAEENHNAYIVMDDWIDHYVYYPSTLPQAVEYLNQIYGNFVKSGNVHLIFTAQEDKWKKFSDILKDCCMFNLQRLVRLDFKKPSKKQLKEMQNMILCHFQHFDIEENSEKRKNQDTVKKAVIEMEESVENKDEQKQTDDKNKILAKIENCGGNNQNGEEKTVVKKGSIEDLANKIKQEDVFSFPVMIDLICRNERLMEAKNLIFKDRFSSILNLFLERWSKDTDDNEKRSFCILVFAALLGGSISITDFSSQFTGPLYRRICTEHDVYLTKEGEKEKQKPKTENSIENIETGGEETLLMHNRRLKSCLYRISRGQGNTSFVFPHSSLLRFILSFVKKMKSEKFLIESADFEVLLNMCWLDNTFLDKLKMKSIPEGSICISVNSYKPLAERIYSETLKGYRLPQWQNHVFMSHKTFCEVWTRVTKNSKDGVKMVH